MEIIWEVISYSSRANAPYVVPANVIPASEIIPRCINILREASKDWNDDFEVSSTILLFREGIFFPIQREMENGIFRI